MACREITPLTSTLNSGGFLMENLIYERKDVVINNKDIAHTSSLVVAEMFGKDHNVLLRSIREVESNVSGEFWKCNFAQSNYKSRGKEYPMYLMTKDGFTLLAMGFTGKKAMRFKEAYIKRFNDMEAFITSRLLSKTEFPQLTDNIKLMHEEPKPYHYSNEIDMINRIVLGMNTKKFKEINNIKKTESIRNYLSREEMQYIEKLQRVDVGMVIAISDFQERKKALTNYYNMLSNKRLIE